MMSLRARIAEPTLLLWIGNGIAALLLLAAVAYRLLPLLPGGGGVEVRPLTAPDVAATTAPAPTEFARNPFDPSGAPWRPAAAAPEKLAGGNVKGVIVLPGVAAVVTDGATVRIGEALEGGTLVGIVGQQLVLEGAGGRTRIDLPGAHRPQLKDLNRSPAPACKDGQC